MKSDVTATTHKERRAPKVVSHLEIRPNMDGGHNVEVHHTHYDYPPKVKEHAGPHEAVSLPKGHVLHSIAKEMGIQTTGTGAGAEENVDAKEAGVMS
jgi:hypothetical protein